ncbi:hypothetical protein HK097_007979 [Rhizophlyctis rosea]|uniref:Uncharacterized protein n=1 Tax=Rhizophlyctis rosea TaxID=64517 RepID=A0AAD5SLE1_9FUNG|nr:hypothetical protein HK097_007979 [Rhizophlyctis rosea]
MVEHITTTTTTTSVAIQEFAPPPSVVVSVRDNTHYPTPAPAPVPQPPAPSPKLGFWGSIWSAVAAPFQSQATLPPSVTTSAPAAPHQPPAPQPASLRVLDGNRGPTGLAVLIEDGRSSHGARPSNNQSLFDTAAGRASLSGDKARTPAKALAPPAPAPKPTAPTASGNSNSWFGRTFGKLWPFSSNDNKSQAKLLPLSSGSSSTTNLLTSTSEPNDAPQSLEHRLSTFHQAGFPENEECPECEGTQFLADGRMCMRCDAENSPTRGLLSRGDSGYGDFDEWAASSTAYGLTGWSSKGVAYREKDGWTGIVNGYKLRSTAEKAKEKIAEMFGGLKGGMFGQSERASLRRGSVEVIDDFAMKTLNARAKKMEARQLVARKEPKVKMPHPRESGTVKCKKAVKAVKKKVAKLVKGHKRAEAIKELESFWAMGDPRGGSTTSLEETLERSRHYSPDQYQYQHQQQHHQQYPQHPQHQYPYGEQQQYAQPYSYPPQPQSRKLSDPPLIDFDSEVPYPARPAYATHLHASPPTGSVISNATSAPSVPSTLEVIPDSLQQLYADLLSNTIGMDELRERYLWTEEEQEFGRRSGLGMMNQVDFVDAAMGSLGRSSSGGFAAVANEYRFPAVSRQPEYDDDNESDDGLGYIYGEEGPGSISGGLGEKDGEGSLVSVHRYEDSDVGMGGLPPSVMELADRRCVRYPPPPAHSASTWGANPAQQQIGYSSYGQSLYPAYATYQQPQHAPYHTQYPSSYDAPYNPTIPPPSAYPTPPAYIPSFAPQQPTGYTQYCPRARPLPLTRTPSRSSLSTRDRFYTYSDFQHHHPGQPVPDTDHFRPHTYASWKAVKDRDVKGKDLPKGLGWAETDEWKAKHDKMERMHNYARNIGRTPQPQMAK